MEKLNGKIFLFKHEMIMRKKMTIAIFNIRKISSPMTKLQK